MDSNITAVLGAAFLVFIFLYLAFSLDKEHFILRFAFLLFGVFSIILIPQAVVNADTYCSLEVTSLTQVGNTTNYTHTLLCEPLGNSTGTAMLNGIWIVLIVVLLYILLYMVYTWLIKMGKIAKR